MKKFQLCLCTVRGRAIDVLFLGAWDVTTRTAADKASVVETAFSGHERLELFESRHGPRSFWTPNHVTIWLVFRGIWCSTMMPHGSSLGRLESIAREYAG